MHKLILLILAVSLTTACARQNDNLNAVLWMQTAAEYRGNSLNVYHSATNRLAQAVKQHDITAAIEQAEMYNCQLATACPALADDKNLIPAVVLDIDETVLDNSIYQARLVRDSGEWNAETWDRWVAAQQASAIPGAVDFIKAAKEHGMAIVYITNRRCQARIGHASPCPQRQDTLDNMKKLGFPDIEKPDLMLLRNQKPDWDQSEKKKRREYVARTYRIAMLIGDDLGDLAPDVKTIGIEARFEFVDRHALLYGNYWFQLGNPTYGSWTKPFAGKDKFDFLEVAPPL